MANDISTGDLIAYIIALSGIISTLVTVISTAVRSGRETEANIAANKKKIEKELKSQEIEDELKKVELNDKLIAVYDKIIEELNEKLESLRKETLEKAAILQENVEKERISRDKEIDNIRKTQIKLAEDKKVLKEAGLLLIKAVEESLTLRDNLLSNNIDVNVCNACRMADVELLNTLKEIKTLFEQRA
jgi:hypothetical protein